MMYTLVLTQATESLSPAAALVFLAAFFLALLGAVVIVLFGRFENR